MTQKASTRLKFKEAWSFPEEVEDRIAGFVNSHPGLWLHAPCGISDLGKTGFGSTVRMVTLDINPDVHPDIVCDIFKMKENPQIQEYVRTFGGFDGVISDPLWYFSETCPKCDHVLTNRTKGLAYPQRRYLSFQVRDVLKPGGYWLFNGLWNPRVKGMDFTAGPNPQGYSIEIPMQAFSSFRNVSLLVYMRRVNGTF